MLGSDVYVCTGGKWVPEETVGDGEYEVPICGETLFHSIDYDDYLTRNNVMLTIGITTINLMMAILLITI